MILDTLYIFALFVLAISILPLLCFVAWTYARIKRRVFEGMARLDRNLLDRLGWEPVEYIGTFDLSAPFRLGWQNWGLLMQQQNLTLQRVLLRGLPDTEAVSDDTRISARRYRRYFCLFIVPLGALIFIPAFFGLSRNLADFFGMPLSVCYILLALGIGVCVFLPAEKFRKWPEVEDQS